MTTAIFQGCTVCLNPKLERQFVMPYIPVEPNRINPDIQEKTHQILDRNDQRMLEIHRILNADSIMSRKTAPPPPPQKPQHQTQYQPQRQTQYPPPQNFRQTQANYYPPPSNGSNPVPKASPVESRSTIKPLFTGIISSAYNFGRGIVDGAIHGSNPANTKQQQQQQQQQIRQTQQQQLPQAQYKYCSRCRSTNPINATVCAFCQLRF